MRGRPPTTQALLLTQARKLFRDASEGLREALVFHGADGDGLPPEQLSEGVPRAPNETRGTKALRLMLQIMAPPGVLRHPEEPRLSLADARLGCFGADREVSAAARAHAAEVAESPEALWLSLLNSSA